MSKPRHIAVLTGKRGGFGAMKPMLREMQRRDDIRLSLIVTDQHVNEKFGATIEEVRRDFTVAAAVDMEQQDGSPLGRSRALGVCLTRMSGVLAELAPDILVLYGDRGEVLATALAAVTLRIPIAHLQGGDVSGNVDELMRHAVTKLAHLHFPSTEISAGRILRMGEEAWRVEAVGDNHVDLICAGDFTDPDTVRGKFDIPVDEKPIVVLLHPETTEVRDGYRDMRTLLDVVFAEGRRVIAVYPCSDHGYEDIVRALEESQGHTRMSLHRNIDAPDFWGLLDIAGVFIGNSSAGLIETPYFHIPAINIGERQKGRQHAENVIHCGYAREHIAAALDRALHDEDFAATVKNCSQPFGDGQAYQRIVDALTRVKLDQALLDKRLTY